MSSSYHHKQVAVASRHSTQWWTFEWSSHLWRGFFLFCWDISPSAAFMLCYLPKEKQIPCYIMNICIYMSADENENAPRSLDLQRLNYQHVLCNLLSSTFLSPQFCVDWFKWDRQGGEESSSTYFLNRHHFQRSNSVRFRIVILTLHYFAVRGERWHHWTKMKFLMKWDCFFSMIDT